MKRLLVGVTLCLLAVGAAATASPVVAQDDYSLTVENSLDVPTQNVEYGGDTYEISSIGVVDPGGTVQVSASGPSDGYEIALLTGDEDVADSRQVSGDASTTFSMSSRTGTYFLALNVDGERERIQPVVVEGYDVSLSIPENATEGEPVDATVDVERRDGTRKDVESVEVVLWNDDYNRTVTIDGDGEGQYNTTVTVDEPGNFTAHATVRGEQTIDGENELLALSDRHEVNVSAAPEDDSDDDTDGGDSGASAGETDGNATETADGNATATATEAADGDGTATPTETPTEGEGGGAEPEDTETDDGGVVTPADTTEPDESAAEETPTAGDGPVGLPGMLSALAAALAALRLRRH
ncbi:hypothetical protein [Halomicrobium salinisoli]|uniref:hypothetical protein n=1 Tax=Halomicrobium salinisoli TaxID=2878391 RepID=UPI001CF075E6|nr:hypothetical protein [Halomicrobium salinisoli]